MQLLPFPAPQVRLDGACGKTTAPRLRCGQDSALDLGNAVEVAGKAVSHAAKRHRITGNAGSSYRELWIATPGVCRTLRLAEIGVGRPEAGKPRSRQTGA